MESKDFEKLKGELLFVVYSENGRDQFIKGRLNSVSNEFMEIQTLNNRFFINLDSIVKIKVELERWEKFEVDRYESIEKGDISSAKSQTQVPNCGTG